MKEKKLEQLTKILDEFKLSINDVIFYWVQSGRLDFASLKCLSSVETSEKSKTSEHVFPGMFVSSDNQFYSRIVPGVDIKGVVGYVAGRKALVLCLRQENSFWSSDYLSVSEDQKIISGQIATCKLLELSQKRKKKAEAALWCYEYVKDGVKQGEAFLPSLTELKLLFPNKTAINLSLDILDADLFNDCYWSSTECSDNRGAWEVDMQDGNKYYRGKIDSSFVRPVFWVDF